MKKEVNRLIGFTCAYTPYRVMPTGSAPEQAGLLLHDNMCPHVKRVHDRALANDLPETLDQLREKNRKKTLAGGSTRLLETYNIASTKPAQEALEVARKILKEDQYRHWRTARQFSWTV